MKILIIGTPRQPTLNVGSNGLGRHVYDYIGKFVEKGDDVTVMLHPKSKLEWPSVKKLILRDETKSVPHIKAFIKFNNFDVVIDNTHFHLLSKTYHDESLPIINFIHDEECDYMPPNTLIGNSHQKKKYKNGKVVKTGIKFGKYKLYGDKKDYFCFCAKMEHRKGYDIADKVSKAKNIKTIFAGPRVPWQKDAPDKVDNWIGEISSHTEFCEFIGNAKAIFCPSRSDAGGLVLWEACALGTPVLTTSDSGAKCNVIHGKTGFIADNFEELCEFTEQVGLLKPTDIRAEGLNRWDLNKNFEETYTIVKKFKQGLRW